ncbi:MAG: single-stranded DNA-binding protein [Patescibacteria group bacterium]
MNLNRATIIGNVTRDPELRTTPNGQNVANFGVATNYSWTDSSGQKQEKAEFHNIVAWGKLADICAQYLGKGRKVYVEGRLQTREWDAQDGTKRNRTEIVCENMIMLDRAPGGANANAGAAAPRKMESSAEAPASDEIKVEDIPF